MPAADDQADGRTLTGFLAGDAKLTVCGTLAFSH
jgi:hypothetical protein